MAAKGGGAAKRPRWEGSAEELAQVLTPFARATRVWLRYDEAATVLQACMKMAPDHIGCGLLWANVLKKQGKDDEAQRAFDRAVQLREEQAKSRRRP